MATYYNRVDVRGELLTQDEIAASDETGTRAPSLDFAGRAHDALETGGLLTRLQPFVPSEAYPVWFRDWVEIEREATSLRWFEPQVVPGLLQTEEYARAVLQAAHPASSEGEIDRLVSARMDRQSVLAKEEPPLLWLIIEEGVLTRPVGGPRVMRQQIDYLSAARQPKIMLQVLPIGAGAHPGLDGRIAIASFAGSPDVVYLDNALAGQIAERAEDVARIALLYDILKAEALAPRASIDLVRKAIETWT